MRKWVTAKLQLLFKFIFMPVLTEITKLRLENDGHVEVVKRELVKIEDVFYGTDKKPSAIIELLSSIFNKPMHVFMLTTGGKVFPLNDTFHFDVRYNFAMHVLEFRLMMRQLLVDTYEIILKEGSLKEDDPDYPVFDYGRKLLMQPKIITKGKGDKDCSTLDYIGYQASNQLAHFIMRSAGVIIAGDVLGLCNFAFFYEMKFFYEKAEEKKKAEAEKKGIKLDAEDATKKLNETKEVIDPLPASEGCKVFSLENNPEASNNISIEEIIKRHFSHPIAGQVYDDNEYRYMSSTDIADYLAKTYGLARNNELLKTVDRILGENDFKKSPIRKPYEEGAIKRWTVLFKDQVAI